MSKEKIRLSKKYRNFKQFKYWLIKHNEEARLYNEALDLEGEEEYYKPKDNGGTIVFTRKIIFESKGQ